MSGVVELSNDEIDLVSGGMDTEAFITGVGAVASGAALFGGPVGVMVGLAGASIVAGYEFTKAFG